MRIILFFLLLIFSLNILHSEKLCIYFSRKNDVSNLKTPVNSLEYDKSDDYLWIGTDSSLITKQELIWDYGTPKINEFPIYYINKLKQDLRGYVWICTKKGIYADSRIKRCIIDTSNSPLPDNNITSVDVDSNNRKWFGTSGGIAVFNDNTWTIFNKSNTEMPSDSIIDLVFDKNKNLWAITPVSLIKFDGSDWYFFENDDCEMMSEATCISVDSNSKIYIGTKKGLLCFFDDKWTCYDISNSKLPDNWITSMSVDKDNRLFIGTKKGLAILNGDDWLDFEEYNSNNLRNEISILTNKIIKYPFFSELTVCTKDGIFYYTFEDSNYIKCYELINNIIQDYDILTALCEKDELVTPHFCYIKNNYTKINDLKIFIENNIKQEYRIGYDKKVIHRIIEEDKEIMCHRIILLGKGNNKLYFNFFFIEGKWLLNYLSESTNILR